MKVIGFALALFGFFIISTAYVRQFNNYKFRKTGQGRHSSPAPFVGPIFTIVGLALMQIDLPGWIWLLFLMDPDSLIIILGLPLLIKQLTSNNNQQ